MRSCLLALILAPAHIAAAVNTPLISLFGCDRPYFLASLLNNMIQFWREITETPMWD
ncbi:glycosyltransferase family 9 protein [Shigella flexneri]